MNNYLPKVQTYDINNPVLEAYGKVGMMALIDLAHSGDTLATSIKSYFEETAQHVKGSTVLVAIGQEEKPLGYACWTQTSDGSYYLKRTTAPFGDYLDLLTQVQEHLPDGVNVISIHEQSARREQMAW